MKISIVIPTFNEAEQIAANLVELEKYMNDYKDPRGWEIIVVNDGSTDTTLEILNTLKQKKEWLKIVDMVSHDGRGKALRAGIEASSADIIVTLDADLSYAPYHIDKMVEKLEEEKADIVLASAYMKGGTVKNVPFNRLLISKLGNKILSYMFKGEISVLTCLVRAYRRDFIKRLDLHSNDKEIHLEILYKARVLGGKIVEVPADLHWRKEKLAKITLGGKEKRRSTIKIKKTSSSHLFFALLNRPGMMFWIPGSVLTLLSAFIFTIILKLIYEDIISGTFIYYAFRNSMINGTLSWFTMVFSFFLGIQFLTLGFITSQNKHNYEEMYKTCNTIFNLMKKEKE